MNNETEIERLKRLQQEENEEIEIYKTLQEQTEKSQKQNTKNEKETNINNEKKVTHTNTTLPRKRLTETDYKFISFLSSFPGATAETLSILDTRKENPFGYKPGELLSTAGAEKRLRKLKTMNLVTRHKAADTKEIHYGITELGLGYLEGLIDRWIDYTPLNGIALSRINHYAQTARIAAQFYSPANYFRDSLHIEPVSTINNLLSEKYIRANFNSIITKGTDYGLSREETLRQIRELAERKIITSQQEIWELYPAVLEIAHPQTNENSKHNIAIPDLAVLATDNRTGDQIGLWIEIELTIKTLPDYINKVTLIRNELQKGIYDKVIYFTDNQRIANLFTKAQEITGIDLFSTGELTILPLQDKYGNSYKKQRRITL